MRRQLIPHSRSVQQHCFCKSNQHDNVAEDQTAAGEKSANTSEAAGPLIVTMRVQPRSEGGPSHVGNEQRTEEPIEEPPGPTNTPVNDGVASVEEKSDKPEAHGKKGPDDANGSQASPKF